MNPNLCETCIFSMGLGGDFVESGSAKVQTPIYFECDNPSIDSLLLEQVMLRNISCSFYIIDTVKALEAERWE